MSIRSRRPVGNPKGALAPAPRTRTVLRVIIEPRCCGREPPEVKGEEERKAGRAAGAIAVFRALLTSGRHRCQTMLVIRHQSRHGARTMSPDRKKGFEKMETTGRALIDHWDWTLKKGLMNKNTARSLRTACAQVLDVLDAWENVDVKTLDIEGTLTQFQNLKKKKFKPTVLDTYKRRFRQAVRSYLAYLEDPAGWKPNAMRTPRAQSRNGSEQPAAQTVSRSGVFNPQTNLVDYPFPIREGIIAHLVLPRDLTGAEVKRLAAFMATLVLDDASVAK